MNKNINPVNSESAFLFEKPLSGTNETNKHESNIHHNQNLTQQTQKTVRNIRPINLKKLQKIGLGREIKVAIEKTDPQIEKQPIATTATLDMASTNVLSQMLGSQSHLTEPSINSNKPNSAISENSKHIYNLKCPDDRLAHAKSVLSKMLLNKKHIAERLQKNYDYSSESSCAELNKNCLGDITVTSRDLTNFTEKTAYPTKQLNQIDSPNVLNFRLSRARNMVAEKNVTVIKKGTDSRKHTVDKREKPVTLLQNCVESINEFVKQNTHMVEEKKSSDKVTSLPSKESDSILATTKNDTVYMVDGKCISNSEAVLESTTITMQIHPNTANLNFSKKSISTKCLRSHLLIKSDPNIQSTEIQADVLVPRNASKLKIPLNPSVIENTILSQDEQIGLTASDFDNANKVHVTSTVTSKLSNAKSHAFPKKLCTSGEEHIDKLSTVIIPPGMCLDKNLHQSKKILLKKKGYKNVSFEPIFNQVGGTNKVVQPVRFRVCSGKFSELAKTITPSIGVSSPESAICTFNKSADIKDCLRSKNNCYDDPKHISDLNLNGESSIQRKMVNNEIGNNENVKHINAVDEILNNIQLHLAEENIRGCQMTFRTSTSLQEDEEKVCFDQNKEEDDNCPVTAVEYIANLFKEDLDGHQTKLPMDDRMLYESDVKAGYSINVGSTLIELTSGIAVNESAYMRNVNNRSDLNKESVLENVMVLTKTDMKDGDPEYIKLDNRDMTGGEASVSDDTNSNLQIGSIVMINSANLQNIEIFSPENKNSGTNECFTESQKQLTEDCNGNSICEENKLFSNSDNSKYEGKGTEPIIIAETVLPTADVLTDGNICCDSSKTTVQVDCYKRNFHSANNRNIENNYSLPLKSILKTSSSKNRLNKLGVIMEEITLPIIISNIPDKNIIGNKFNCIETNQYPSHLRKTKVNLLQRRKLQQKQLSSMVDTSEILNDGELTKDKQSPRGTSEMFVLNKLNEIDVLATQTESAELTDSVVLLKTQSALEMFAEACERHVSEPIQVSSKDQNNLKDSLPEVVKGQKANLAQHRTPEVDRKISNYGENHQHTNVLERDNSNAIKNSTEMYEKASCFPTVQTGVDCEAEKKTNDIKDDLGFEKRNNIDVKLGKIKTAIQKHTGDNTDHIEYTFENNKKEHKVYALSKRLRMDSNVNTFLQKISLNSNDNNDVNLNYEKFNNESCQQYIVKGNRKRLRKTEDDIKKTRTVTFASESDSDNVDGKLPSNNKINEFCGFYEQEVDMQITPDETSINVTQDTNLEVPSTEKSCEQADEVLNKLKVRTLQPFITRCSISRSIPLKKRWDLGRKSHEETDITDDTSPADDEDDEELHATKHSSDLSKVHTLHHVPVKNTQHITPDQESDKQACFLEGSKTKLPTINIKASGISMNKFHESFLNKSSTPETSSKYSYPPISTRPIDISLKRNVISIENDLKFEKNNVSRRNIIENVSKVNSYNKCDLIKDTSEPSTDVVDLNQSEFSLQKQKIRGLPNRQLPIMMVDFHDKIKNISSSVNTQKRKRGRPKRALPSLEDHKIDICKRLRTANSSQEELFEYNLTVHQSTKSHLISLNQTKSEINVKRRRGRPKRHENNCRQDVEGVNSEKPFKNRPVEFPEKIDAIETISRRSSLLYDEDLTEDELIHMIDISRRTDHLKSPNSKDNPNLRKSIGRPKRSSSLNRDDIKERSHQETKMSESPCDQDTALTVLNTPDSSLKKVISLEKSEPISNLDPQNLLQKKAVRGTKPAIPDVLGAFGEDQNVSSVPKFNARLLLIRSRSQLETDELLTEDFQIGNSKGKLKCGLCLALVPSVSWNNHLADHYGVGWIAGKAAINVNERSVVLATIINYMKANPTKVLTCRMCPKQYRSALGILQHIELCGAIPQRIPCEFCCKTYSKLSLPVHQRVCTERFRCTTKENERSADVLESDVNDNENLFNNSGRLKRISSRKAESKLKSLIEENKKSSNLEFNFIKYVKYFAPLDLNKYRSRWDDDLQNKSVAQCPFKICRFRSTLVDDLEEHIKTCKYQTMPGFHCKLCKKKMIFETDVEASLHVKEKHQACIDLYSENDEGDFTDHVLEDENFSTESDISSGVETDEADEENHKITGRQYKRTAPVFNNKLYTPRKNNVFGAVKNKWTEFINRHYIINSLYGSLIPNYFMAHSEIISQFENISMSSLKCAFDEHFSFKNAKCNLPDETNWHTLKRFQTITFKEDCFFFIGGSIKTIRWVPLPKHVEEQYLAVLYREDIDDYTQLLDPKKKSSFILLLKINSSYGEETTNTSIESELHYVIHIPEGPVHDIAFMPSGGYDEIKNRLALLAVGTANTSINIFPVPIKLNGNEFSESGKTKVIELRAEYVLYMELTDKITRSQCTIIRWSETLLHNFIFASFANGFVGIWDISEEDNLNRLKSNNDRIFYTPLSVFYVGEKSIIAFDVHYDTTGPRWIGMITASRRFIVYDIRDMATPIIINTENCKTSINSMDWPPIWDMIPVGYCDTMQCGRSVIAMNPLNLINHNIKIDNTLSGVSSVHYSPMQNVLVCGTDNGDVIFLNPRECHFEDILSSSMKNSRAVAMMKIQILNNKALKGIGLAGAEMEVRNDDFQMIDEECVEKYGLIFGSTLKYQPGNRDDYYSIERKPNLQWNPYLRISATRFNMNKNSECLVGIGYENGFLRIMNFKRSKYFD